MAEKRGNSKPSNLGAFALLIILLFFLALIDIATLIIWRFPAQPSSQPPASKLESVKVTEIISGDMIKLSDGRTLKLIGIDAPETDQNYYEESISMLKFLILDKQVRLESDAEDRDSSGNLLRYVYVDYNNQELFVNLESVKQGYSLPFHMGANVKYRTEIEAARAECVKNKLNLCG